MLEKNERHFLAKVVEAVAPDSACMGQPTVAGKCQSARQHLMHRSLEKVL